MITSEISPADTETAQLIQRWIIAFCEAPPLIDVPLMTRILDDHDRKNSSQAA